MTLPAAAAGTHADSKNKVKCSALLSLVWSPGLKPTRQHSNPLPVAGKRSTCCRSLTCNARALHPMSDLHCVLHVCYCKPSTVSAGLPVIKPSTAIAIWTDLFAPFHKAM